LLESSVLVRTSAEIAVFIRFSLRRSAVTMTVSTPALAEADAVDAVCA
jgi:hypothetical protein